MFRSKPSTDEIKALIFILEFYVPHLLVVN